MKKHLRTALVSLLILTLVWCLPTKGQGGTGVASAYPTIAQPTALPSNTEVQIASTGVVTLPTSGNPIYVVNAWAEVIVPANSTSTTIMFKLYFVPYLNGVAYARTQIGGPFFVRLSPTTTAQAWTATTVAYDLSQGQNILAGFTGVSWILTADVFGGSGSYSNGVQLAVIQAA